MQAQPAVGFTVPFTTKLSITPNLASKVPSELWVDSDGEHILDYKGPFTEQYTVTYSKPGRFMPMVTIQTESRRLY